MPINGHERPVPAPSRDTELGAVADVRLQHRARDGYITEVSVAWAPNGFILQVKEVEEGAGYLEGTKSAVVQLPRNTRRERGPL